MNGRQGASHSLARKKFYPVVLCFFIGSGFAALVYEIVWFQLLELVIGSTAASLAVLRMSFGVSGNEWHALTLRNYADLADSYFLRSLGLTLKLAFQSMVCAVLLAIPVALATPWPRLRVDSASRCPSVATIRTSLP